MANKEATVYCVDMGASTKKHNYNREVSDLDYGMSYVYKKIATAMAPGAKGTGIGIIGFRTKETDNSLSSTDDAYEHISVLKPIGVMELSEFKGLQRLIQPSPVDEGDAISAIVLAISIIADHTTLKTGKLGKFTRRIVLLTNGTGPMVAEEEDIDSIAGRINDLGISLTVVGIDFDDEDGNFIEKNKTSTKRQNEKLLRQLTEKCNDALFGTVAEAISYLEAPQVKTTKPYKTYEGRLQLGDFEKYPETAMFIDVVRYFKTKIAKPISATNYAVKTENESAQSSNTLAHEDGPSNGERLSSIKTSRVYIVNDPSGESAGGKKHVLREDLEKGYEYGRTAVHMSESDQNVTQLETFKSLSILGFIPSEQYDRHLNMGESCITIAQTVNDKAKMALSSLIHALFETESYAVARIVTANWKNPQLILMAPLIEPDMEALIDVPLPFAEDLRTYRFPPLDRVVTTSGSLLKTHRNLPTNKLVDAMSKYVDSMDLSTAGKDDEGEPAEYMPFEETFSPAIHRINQAIRDRAINPDAGVQEPPELLLKWSRPPKELVASAKPQLKALIEAGNVKKVPPKTMGKRGRVEPIKPLSGLNVRELLNREKRQKISADNAVPEFKQLLETTHDEGAIKNAVKEMGDITEKLISVSTGGTKYEEAYRNLYEMRTGMISMEMPEYYNTFVLALKEKIAKDKLNSNRADFWFGVGARDLGLIDKTLVEYSDVTAEEAKKFLPLRSASSST